MVNLIASPERILQFGYEGEDNVTKIIFNYDETWLSYGDGEFKVRILRPGETQPYNATEVVDNRDLMTLTMTVTNTELSIAGYGRIQLVYVCNGAIKKSAIYRFVVKNSIDSTVVDPPKDGGLTSEQIAALIALLD